MITQILPIIRRSEKTKTVTGKSEYLFHFTSHPVQEDICYFEGYYKDAGLKAGLHIHKTITEIFTVLEGEFTFHLPQDSEVLRPGDTFIASPFQPHGFSSNLPNSRMQILSIGFKNRENFFIELSKIANGEIKPDQNELEAFFNRYDQYTVK
ncbi:cupin domain-containing protein [Terrimonas pollutisoli]|uniref:cupin domain-containing protein n=1 Tax=Terrimonas pollutisoli TaxID=3034147 RepID=UPI0023EAA858|nr:cupin domain-containing protein [Terrimonas sp. H1YJ31]